VGCLRLGHARGRPGRGTSFSLGDKPALFVGSREIAHLEAPGVIDLRITRAGWAPAGKASVTMPPSIMIRRAVTGSNFICALR
jgi:hypothetical protein